MKNSREKTWKLIDEKNSKLRKNNRGKLKDFIYVTSPKVFDEDEQSRMYWKKKPSALTIGLEAKTEK